MDPLGLREKTDQEKKNAFYLTRLERRAKNAGDEKFAEKIKKVHDTYDKQIDEIKEGEKDPKRLKIVNVALRKASSTGESDQYAHSAGSGAWKNRFKCNKFVGDVIEEAGGEAKIEKGRMTYRYPIAGEWADSSKYQEKYPVIKIELYTFEKGESGNRVVDETITNQSQEPQIGDIVSFGEATSSSDAAHVGIYIGEGLYISATTAEKLNQKNIVIKEVDGTRTKLYRSVELDNAKKP